MQLVIVIVLLVVFHLFSKGVLFERMKISLDDDLSQDIYYVLLQLYSKLQTKHLFAFLLTLCSVVIDFVSFSINHNISSLLSSILRLSFLIERPLLTILKFYFQSMASESITSAFVFGYERLFSLILAGSSVISACGVFFGVSEILEQLFSEHTTYSSMINFITSCFSFALMFIVSNVLAPPSLNIPRKFNFTLVTTYIPFTGHVLLSVCSMLPNFCVPVRICSLTDIGHSFNYGNSFKYSLVCAISSLGYI
ncbi:hypothetical protein GEMRC1_010781 [Eukaryota sp. GEM-RC1]